MRFRLFCMFDDIAVAVPYSEDANIYSLQYMASSIIEYNHGNWYVVKDLHNQCKGVKTCSSSIYELLIDYHWNLGLIRMECSNASVNAAYDVYWITHSIPFYELMESTLEQYIEGWYEIRNLIRPAWKR